MIRQLRYLSNGVVVRTRHLFVGGDGTNGLLGLRASDLDVLIVHFGGDCTCAILAGLLVEERLLQFDSVSADDALRCLWWPPVDDDDQVWIDTGDVARCVHDVVWHCGHTHVCVWGGGVCVRACVCETNNRKLEQKYAADSKYALNSAHEYVDRLPLQLESGMFISINEACFSNIPVPRSKYPPPPPPSECTNLHHRIPYTTQRQYTYSQTSLVRTLIRRTFH